MSADDFAAALAIIFGFAGLLCLLDWLLDRADDNEQAEQSLTVPVDLVAVHADDRLLDRVGVREPAQPYDEPVTEQLKVWRDEIDTGLDDRLDQWRAALGMDGAS
jgi:hypothetical protein